MVPFLFLLKLDQLRFPICPCTALASCRRTSCQLPDWLIILFSLSSSFKTSSKRLKRKFQNNSELTNSTCTLNFSFLLYVCLYMPSLLSVSLYLFLINMSPYDFLCLSPSLCVLHYLSSSFFSLFICLSLFMLFPLNLFSSLWISFSFSSQSPSLNLFLCFSLNASL